MKPKPQPLTSERLAQIERFARRVPDCWSVSDAMAHHQQCRKLVAELVDALRKGPQPEQVSLFEVAL